MLVQDVAAKYPGKVAFVSENLGASKLADRFGVKGYPAIFVDEVLVARPRDFGFFGEDGQTGRYTPWRNADSQARFRADLTRMVELALAGKQAELKQERADLTKQSDQIAAFPKFSLTDLNGKPLSADQVAGRAILVEFWATWCPPCRSTLEWLGRLKQKYGDNLAILALAVESPEDKVRASVKTLNPQIRWAMTDAPTAQAFGDIVSVPTMLLFDRSGKTARVFYGAPPDLHEQAEKAIDRVIQ